MTGTYVEFLLKSESEDLLRLWITADLGLEEPKYPLHSTTVYSRKKIDYQKIPLPKEAYLAHSGGYRILLLNWKKDELQGDTVDLALEVNCNALYYSHTRAIQAGAEWDFPSFFPHITIQYGMKLRDLIGFPLRIPYFGLQFEEETVLDLGEDGRPKRS